MNEQVKMMEQNSKRGMINDSKEDYLEAILIRIREDGACRVTDLAEQMGYSKSSASVALKKLEKEGYIERRDWRILLTEEGYEIASKIDERHQFFQKWFQTLGVSEATAKQDACRIEHVLSNESYRKIKEYLLSLDEEQADVSLSLS